MNPTASRENLAYQSADLDGLSSLVGCPQRAYHKETGREVVCMSAWVDLYWLPLGAGGHCVRFNGHVYERIVALREQRSACDLYHCALQVRVARSTYAIEMGPVWNIAAPDRGAVCQGPVGTPWLGRFRAFQYEVRCWRDGYIPDLAEAVDSPLRVSQDAARASAVLDVLRSVPPLTWGRDELGVGDMWNSNSVVSWALAKTGHDVEAIRPPRGGRAPGWNAGIALTTRRPRVPAVI